MSPVAVSLALALPSAWAAEPDADGDGFTASLDCDDTNAAVNPDATESCDGIDDDCDGLVDDDDGEVDGQVRWWPDVDGDGLGGDPYVTACARPRGYIRLGGDCDDADASVGSAILAVVDFDGDGYGSGGTAYFCPPLPSGYVPFVPPFDCDDADPATNPSTAEVCNDVDDNCDDLVDEDDPALIGNVFYDDADRDGYGDDATADATGCVQPHGYVAVGGDCAPYDVATHPDAPEICDGEDNDCDGAVDDSTVPVQWYADADGDGYGVSSDIVRGCAQPRGYARGRGDCDDGDADVSPMDDEVCGNGIDDDCDGAKDNCTLLTDDVAGLAIEGSDGSHGWFGAALAVGDLAADGAADLLVGAPYEGYGRVFAFSGPASGSADTSDADRVVAGDTYDYGFGAALSYADADGDGTGDLFVGAPDAGHAFLFLGPVTAGATIASGDADAELWNYGYGTELGAAVQIMGDHDGDGIPDLAVGMPGEDLKDGGVAVISGDSEGGHDLRDDALYRYRSRKHDRCGWTLASMDNNGDGLDDLLVGAQMGGSADLMEGGAPPGGTVVSSASDATLLGNRLPDRFGWDVATGDLDGDGHVDALVGAPYALTAAGLWGGAAYAFFGPLSGTTAALTADARWEGAVDGPGNYGFGFSIATGGDIDGDGEPDTLIGDIYEHQTNAGAVYLQLGTPSGVIATDHLTAFDSSDEQNWLGHDVAFVPDWDGDGRSEIAVGAPFAPDAAGANVGEVSVIFSQSLFE